MKIANFRDWAISICAVVLTLAILGLSAYIVSSVISMQKQVSEYSATTSSGVSESISCHSNEEGKYTAEITLQNNGLKEVNNLNCEVYESGNLKVENSLITINKLPASSSDICLFSFTGKASNTPVKFKFTYDGSTHNNFCLMQ
jgi:hypothetical protein